LAYSQVLQNIDDKITEQHEYRDQEIEALMVEGYIQ
jgi:hypothetical protein